MDCQTCIHLIDEYFDQRLPRKTRKKIVRHLTDCADCRQSYLEYEKLFADLKSVEPVSCPDEVIQSVNEIVGIKKGTEKRFLSGLSVEFPIGFQPLRLAGLAVSVILIAIILFSQFHKSTPEFSEKYTQEEIERAAEQVKLALAYVNAATAQASEILEKQVIPEDVIKPMKSSLKQALQPLLDGGKS